MVLDRSWQLSKNPNFRPKFAQIWPGRWVKSSSENKRSIQEARLLKSILRSMRVFAGFELRTMHRSDKGPKIDAPLFGSTSPFGHTGCWKSGLRGEGFAPQVAIGKNQQIQIRENLKNLENLAKMRKTQKSSPKSELERPITFSTTHRETWDPDHSIERVISLRKKVFASKSNNRIARKSTKRVESLCFCPGPSWRRFAPVTVLLSEHGGILGR